MTTPAPIARMTSDLLREMREPAPTAGEVAMPEPYDFCYEFITPFGLHKKFSPAAHNGAGPSATVRIFTEDQLRAYGDARAAAALARVPLTKTDVARIWRDVYGGTRADSSAFEFAKAIEAAHGITAPTEGGAA